MGDPHEPWLVWDFTTFYKFRDNRDPFRPSIVQVEKAMAPFNHQHGKSYRGMQLEPLQRPAAWRRFLRSFDLEPEDLLAIPICLLTGFGFMLYSLGSSGMFQALVGGPTPAGNGAASTVVAWISVPAAAVRQWFS